MNEDVAAPLARVFKRLYALRFPIRYLRVDIYVPGKALPAHNDVSGSFECREAVPSPCVGGRRSGLVVEPRVRPRDRPQPAREPIRRLRQGTGRQEVAVRRALATAEGHGDRGSRAGLPLDRLGLGRHLDRRHEGLHALLGERAVARGPLHSDNELRRRRRRIRPLHGTLLGAACARSSPTSQGSKPGSACWTSAVGRAPLPPSSPRASDRAR